MAERRRRLDATRRRNPLRFLGDPPITLDPETSTRVWTVTQHLAERFRLTLYDAAYLELAARQNPPLASLDHELRTACTSLAMSLPGSDRKERKFAKRGVRVRASPVPKFRKPIQETLK